VTQQAVELAFVTSYTQIFNPYINGSLNMNTGKEDGQSLVSARHLIGKHGTLQDLIICVCKIDDIALPILKEQVLLIVIRETSMISAADGEGH